MLLSRIDVSLSLFLPLKSNAKMSLGEGRKIKVTGR